MKTKLLTLALSIFIFSAANAQFHLGIKGGANVSKITGKSFKEEFSSSYHLGGFAEIGLGSKFFLQPEVLFNQLQQDTSSQFKDIYQNVLSSNRSNIKLNYLSVPILLNYKASNFLSFQVGPQFGVLIDQNKNLLENGQEAFKKGDFSMLGGVQLKLASFRVYGRYALGLSNINDIDNKDKWKSQSFQIGVGIAIL
ncbi:MAG: porin family protein [Bacteroidota bacterium]|nr:porin family protein [Ferruginibacter sp.]